MTLRLLEINDLLTAREELSAVGPDKIGIELMAPKAVGRALRLKGLRPTAANIIKQEMLSFGGDAAVACGAINHSIERTDVLILGTLRQFRRLIKRLTVHCFGLPEISTQIEQALKRYDGVPAPVKMGDKTWNFGHRAYIMGILNVTPDSFSDGGKYVKPEDAVSRACRMTNEGADIIDVGGESTRPGAGVVSAEEELRRVLPVIKALAAKKVPVSIDTRKAKVAEAALKAGARMVNDVSGLRFDKKMAGVIARHKVPVCIMHARGNPRTMQKNPVYADLMGEIIEYLAGGLAIAQKAGILLEKIIVDPGLGFGKTVEHNLTILKKLKELKVLGRPILVGPSRKSMIGKVLGLPVTERLEGTAAAVVFSIMQGASIIRAHDVKEIARVVRMTEAINKGLMGRR